MIMTYVLCKRPWDLRGSQADTCTQAHDLLRGNTHWARMDQALRTGSGIAGLCRQCAPGIQNCRGIRAQEALQHQVVLNKTICKACFISYVHIQTNKHT